MPDNSSRTERPPESPDVAARSVLLTALALLAFVAISIAGARIYYVSQVRGPLSVPPTLFEAPRLQINDVADLVKFEQQQRAQLNGYAWIDRDQGIIQIPVDRAIALIAAKGASAYEPIEPSAPADKAGGSAKP